MERARFERLVRQAMDTIPDEFFAYLHNVDVVVEQYPSQDQLGGHTVDDEDHLLGLYEGIPLTEREDYGMVLPDKITLFQGPIEAICSSDDEVVEEVRKTVVHEVAHHFGIDDHTLHDLGV